MFLDCVSLLAAALPEMPRLGESAVYLLVGFGVVMATLLALAFVCRVVGWFFGRFPVLASVGTEADSKPSGGGEAPEVDGRIVAVIGAAVDQALGGRYRIKSISPVSKR